MLRLSLYGFTLLLIGSQTVFAGVIQLRSGNGAIGSIDSEITMLVGPADGPFGVAFTPSDFAAARSGLHASIVNPHPDWISSLPADPLARWITTDPRGADRDGDPFGRSALYAIDFEIGEPFADATLQLFYSVDNRVGELDENGQPNGPNEGVFINGIAVSGTSRGGNFSGQFSLTRTDIAPLLHSGTNTLYIDATDLGGPSGLIFNATIMTTPVPEPSTILLLAIGCVPVLIGRECLRRRHGRLSFR